MAASSSMSMTHFLPKKDGYEWTMKNWELGFDGDFKF